MANRLDGFSRYAKTQAVLDDVRLFDLSHWLVVDHAGSQIGVTGGGPFSDEFATGTRVLSVLPVAEGPVFHHPNCEPGCREPSFDWVTERGATVAETIRHWLDEGVIEGWRSEAFQDAVERAEGLRQGDRTTRNYEIAWDESRPLRSADSEAYDLDHLWRSYIIVSEVEVLPASAKHTKWFLRRLDEGEWRFLAALARRTQA